MTNFKVRDVVRVKAEPYNIADHRIGKRAVITRIDAASRLLPVRIEYQDGTSYSWTNYESLELVTAAPSQHAEIGKDILDRMLALKGAIATRDAAIATVNEQTKALDALLASVGLKRGETVPAEQRTALQDLESGVIQVDTKYHCTSGRLDFFTAGARYVVCNLDLRDHEQPVAFIDDDEDDYYVSRDELKYFVRTV